MLSGHIPSRQSFAYRDRIHASEHTPAIEIFAAYESFSAQSIVMVRAIKIADGLLQHGDGKAPHAIVIQHQAARGRTRIAIITPGAAPQTVAGLGLIVSCRIRSDGCATLRLVHLPRSVSDAIASAPV